MRKRVLYPLPQSRSPSFHMEGGFFCAVGACGVGGVIGSEYARHSYESASSLSSTAHAGPLLPHGRRHGVVQVRRSFAWEEAFCGFVA